jgi:hypothetical protein
MRKWTLTHVAIFVVAVGMAALVSAPENAEAGSRKSACGGANQRPCGLLEAFPSCDPGLAEDFLQGICVGPAPGGGGGGSASRPTNCGGEGERPCTIFEAFPSCESGLQENFLDGKCVRPGGGTQPEDVANTFQPPNCNEIFNVESIFQVRPGNPRLAEILAGLRGPLGSNLNALYNYRIGPELVASLAWEATIPKDSIGTPVRIFGALAYFAALYCGLTLERDLALESQQALQDNFDEVKGTVAGVKQDVTQVSGGVTTLSASVAALADANVATQQSIATVAAALAALDAETRQKLVGVEARLQEVIQLLNTPPGRRPSFPQ